MGIGLVHQKSSTQKSNSKSSCESEIIGVSEYLPYNLWFLMLMEAQGYEIGSNTKVLYFRTIKVLFF